MEIEEVDPQLEVPEVEGVECGDVSCSGERTETTRACPGPQKVTPRSVVESPLQVVFWNANAWNAQKCEQILETVKISGADLICISDARSTHMEGRTSRDIVKSYGKPRARHGGANWKPDLKGNPNA